jgi:hypothetical protein
MLSVFDLLRAGTLDLELAGYLMARLTQGSSFMVGARPGGAGKTTVMCALLNLLPADVTLAAATPEAMCEPLMTRETERLCLVCHEIGPGPYYAYLWGESLRCYCRLANDDRVLLATNLHADDIDDARQQVCADNGVPESQFSAFEILIFLRVEGRPWDPQRRIVGVYDTCGENRHRLIYDAGRIPALDPAGLSEPSAANRVVGCRRFLKENLKGGTATIEQTRRAVLTFLREQAQP